MTKIILEAGLSLSKRAGGMKYSLNFGKKEAKIIGTKHLQYRVEDREGPDTLFALKPVTDARHSPKIHVMQRKDPGQYHMEFPTSLSSKAQVGVEGKSCRVEVWLYNDGTIYVRRPTAAAIKKALDDNSKQQ